MNVYLFGNKFLNFDNAVFQLEPYLVKKFPEITFIHTDPNEEFPPQGETHITIIDVVQGIVKPTLFDLNDLEEIKKSPVSPHDYDLLLHLLLLKKMNRIQKARIIGIPQRVDIKTCMNSVINILQGQF